MEPGLEFAGGKIRVPCPACGRINAVPPSRVQDGPVCGACRGDLRVDAPIEVDERSLQDLLSGARLPVLVDFYGPHCGPCRMLAPTLARLAQRRSGQTLVAKLDTAAHPDVAGRLRIQGVPTLILFRDGKEVARQVGLVPENVLERLASA
jgi:thioredoxin 2